MDVKIPSLWVSVSTFDRGVIKTDDNVEWYIYIYI
jgi:hypothetical protein